MILSNNESSDHSDVQEIEMGNPAMADAMRKVLSIGKNSSKSSIVLAKAKLLTHKAKPKPKHPGFEIDKAENVDEAPAEVKEEDEDVKDVKDVKTFKRRRIKDVASLGRQKPSALDREKERPLMKIATRGVVQLFNAVREQQKVIEKKVEEVGPSITKREKVMKSIDKKSFLDVLRGCAEPASSKKSPEPEVKTEDEDDDQPNWSVLRDDFMMGAKLKDWDKEEAEKDAEVSVVEESSGKRKKRART